MHTLPGPRDARITGQRSVARPRRWAPPAGDGDVCAQLQRKSSPDRSSTRSVQPPRCALDAEDWLRGSKARVGPGDGGGPRRCVPRVRSARQVRRRPIARSLRADSMLRASTASAFAAIFVLTPPCGPMAMSIPHALHFSGVHHSQAAAAQLPPAPNVLGGLSSRVQCSALRRCKDRSDGHGSPRGKVMWYF